MYIMSDSVMNDSEDQSNGIENSGSSSNKTLTVVIKPNGFFKSATTVTLDNANVDEGTSTVTGAIKLSDVSNITGSDGVAIFPKPSDPTSVPGTLPEPRKKFLGFFGGKKYTKHKNTKHTNRKNKAKKTKNNRTKR